MYKTDRQQLVHSFAVLGKGGPCDITAANDGRVMVVELLASCVHIFNEDGDYLNQFKLHGRLCLS